MPATPAFFQASSLPLPGFGSLHSVGSLDVDQARATQRFASPRSPAAPPVHAAWPAAALPGLAYCSGAGARVRRRPRRGSLCVLLGPVLHRCCSLCSSWRWRAAAVQDMHAVRGCPASAKHTVSVRSCREKRDCSRYPHVAKQAMYEPTSALAFYIALLLRSTRRTVCGRSYTVVARATTTSSIAAAGPG